MLDLSVGCDIFHHRWIKRLACCYNVVEDILHINFAPKYFSNSICGRKCH